MDAVAKGGLRIVGAVHPEAERVLEHRFVAIARPVKQRHTVAGLDRLAAHHSIFCAGAHEMLHRRRPAQHLLDRLRDQRRIGFQLGQLLRILRQRQQPARCRAAGGVMPGGNGDGVIADGFQHADRFAVHRALCDHGGQIIARIGTAILHHLAEISEELLHQREDIHLRIAGGFRATEPLRENAAARHHVGILRAENLLRHLQHAAFVRLWQAQDHHDDTQRIPERDFIDEVAGAAKAGHVVDMRLGDGGDPRFQLFQVLRHEPCVGDAAQFHVQRVIQIDQRAKQVRVTRGALHPLFGLDRRDIGAFPVDEAIIGLGNGDDVGMAGDRPERAETLGLGPVHRVIPAQRGVGIVDAFIGKGGRIDQHVVDGVAVETGEGHGGHWLRPLACTAPRAASTSAAETWALAAVERSASSAIACPNGSS